MKYEEFDIIVRMRGIDLTPQSATELLASILDRVMDHEGDDWGSENRMSLMIPGREGAEDEPRFYPGDDHYKGE